MTQPLSNNYHSHLQRQCHVSPYTSQLPGHCRYYTTAYSTTNGRSISELFQDTFLQETSSSDLILLGQGGSKATLLETESSSIRYESPTWDNRLATPSPAVSVSVKVQVMKVQVGCYWYM